MRKYRISEADSKEEPDRKDVFFVHRRGPRHRARGSAAYLGGDVAWAPGFHEAGEFTVLSRSGACFPLILSEKLRKTGCFCRQAPPLDR
jgi:hypothetical protein